jgi:hypothetical protein
MMISLLQPYAVLAVGQMLEPARGMTACICYIRVGRDSFKVFRVCMDCGNMLYQIPSNCYSDVPSRITLILCNMQ